MLQRNETLPDSWMPPKKKGAEPGSRAELSGGGVCPSLASEGGRVHFPFLAGGVHPHSSDGDQILPAGNTGAVRIPSLLASPHLGQLPSSRTGGPGPEPLSLRFPSYCLQVLAA